MIDLSWLDNPGITNMDPRKLSIMKELVEEGRGKPMNQVFPIVMKANQKLSQAKLSFTSEETAMLLAILTKDMSKEEKSKVDKMKDIVNRNRPRN